MNRILAASLLAASGAFALAACATKAPAPPRPAPPVSRPVPPPIAAPSVYAGDWIDWPLTVGDWRYARDGAGSVARFGVAGQATRFAMRCDTAARHVSLQSLGALDAGRSATMTVRTSAGTARFALANRGGQPPMVAAQLPVDDPTLDRMAFSRGRFVIEIDGAPTPLVVPAWPEVARVIEDCR